MSLAEGVSATIAYKVYSSGVITSNTLADTATDPGASSAQFLRRVSSTLALEKNTYQSAEIRSDRQIVDFRHGTQRVAGRVAGEYSSATYFDFFEAICRGTRATVVSIDQSTLTSIASSSAGTITFTGGDAVTAGLRVGYVIRITGSTGNAIDGENFLITSISGSNRVLHVTPNPATTTASTTFSVAVPGSQIIVPSSGFVSRKFGFEVTHEDLNISRLYTECRLGDVQLRLPATGLSTIEWGVMGRSQLDTDSGSYFTSPSAATTTGIFAAVNGALLVNGVKQGVVTAADMAMNLRPEAADVVGQNFPAEIFLGRADLTGTLTAFLDSNTLIADFVNESELSLLLELTATSAVNSPANILFVPRLKLSSAAVNLTGEAGQSVSFNFQALKYVGASPGVAATTFQLHDTEVS